MELLSHDGWSPMLAPLFWSLTSWAGHTTIVTMSARFGIDDRHNEVDFFMNINTAQALLETLPSNTYGSIE